MVKKSKDENQILAPRPVHPRAVRFHGLFGTSYVKEHMLCDERWTTGSLTEQFKGMTDLLRKRICFRRDKIAKIIYELFFRPTLPV